MEDFETVGVRIDALHPSDEDIIIVSFNLDKYDIGDASKLLNQMRKSLPNNTIFGVPDGAISSIISIKPECIEEFVETVDEVLP
jgi:hypothetical protein